MDKTLHFVCGLPRSGATLLCNILGQNPRFYVKSPPGILDVLFLVRHQWNLSAEFRATPNEPGKARVLKSILDSYFGAGGITQPVLLDKSRAWLGMIEMAEALLERPVKILVPVRDICELVASFEILFRQNPGMREVTQKSAPDGSWETLQGRADLWVRGDQPIGLCHNRIRDALQRGYRDRLHFVEYEDLSRRPAATLAAIYEFLGERPFAHDFNNVAQVTWDLDEMYAIPNLPGIRPRVTPSEPKWPTVLGPWATKYSSNNHLWRQFHAEVGAVDSSSLFAAPSMG